MKIATVHDQQVVELLDEKSAQAGRPVRFAKRISHVFDDACKSISGIAYSKTRQILAVACADQVLLHTVSRGGGGQGIEMKLIHTYSVKNTVIYDISFNHSGSMLAAGCANGNVCLWLGLNKDPANPKRFQYNHGKYAVRCVEFNPISNLLFSASDKNFGFFPVGVKDAQVSLYQVPSKVLSADWSPDGLYLAFGTYRGLISIREKVHGKELFSTDVGAAVPCLRWIDSMSVDAEEDGGASAQSATHQSPHGHNARKQGGLFLVAGSWNQKMHMFALNEAFASRKAGDSKKDFQALQSSSQFPLGYDPCCMSVYLGRYLLIGGSDGNLSLYSPDCGGSFLLSICDAASSDRRMSGSKRLGSKSMSEEIGWTLSCSVFSDFFALGTSKGRFIVYHSAVQKIHDMYQDRYASRTSLTEVTVRHLPTEQQRRIVIPDYIQRIAIFKDVLAIQTPKEVQIYTTVSGLANDVHYKFKSSLPREQLLAGSLSTTAEHPFLGVCSQNILLWRGKRMLLLNFAGEAVRSWDFDSEIRYMRILNGPVGKESALVGLEDGAAFLVFVDNQFPMTLVRHHCAIRGLDISPNRDRLVVTDTRGEMQLYSLDPNFAGSSKVLFKSSPVSSACFNSQLGNLLCYSSGDFVYCKPDDFPPFKQRIQGFIVGFKGSKIFSLQQLMIQVLQFPLSHAMYSYIHAAISQKSSSFWKLAHRVACLGVTPHDWEEIGRLSLEHLQLDIAHNVYVRLRNVRMLELIHSLRLSSSNMATAKGRLVLQAQVHAYRGDFQKAASLYASADRSDLAVQMYVDLCDWNNARRVISTGANAGMSSADLSRRQAEFLLDSEQFAPAANLLWNIGERQRAITVLGERGLVDDLLSLVRSLSAERGQDNLALLKMAVNFFREGNCPDHAIELYRIIGDMKSLMLLYVQRGDWETARGLLRKHPELSKDFWKPYAEHLALNDDFVKAQQAFMRAGLREESSRLLEALANDAVSEHRYADAAQLIWVQCVQQWHNFLGSVRGILAGTDDSKIDADELERNIHHVQEMHRVIMVYHASDTVRKFVDEIFTASSPETLFHAASFVCNEHFNSHCSYGSVSPLSILYVLVQQAFKLFAFRTSRITSKQLRQFVIPIEWLRDVRSIEMQSLAQPFEDTEELIPTCYRCSSNNLFDLDLSEEVQRRSDSCTRCGSQFVRCGLTFEILPLVRFYLDQDLTVESALRVAKQEPEELLFKLLESSDTPMSAAATSSKEPSSSADAVGGGEQQGSLVVQQQQSHASDSLAALFGTPTPAQSDYDGFLNEGPSQNSAAASSSDIDDPFISMMLSSGNQDKLIVDNDMLLGMWPEQVFIVRYDKANSEVSAGTQPVLSAAESKALLQDDRLARRFVFFYRNILPDVPIKHCNSCGSFFDGAEFDSYMSIHNACPICKHPCRDSGDIDVSQQSLDMSFP